MQTRRKPKYPSKPALKGVAKENPYYGQHKNKGRKKLTQEELIDIASFLYDRYEFKIDKQKRKEESKEDG
jgi:hypothetical protein